MSSDQSALIKSSYIYIAEGSIAAALNIPLTIVMLATPHLRKRRDYQVIIGICAADAVFGLAFVISAISRLEIYQQHFNTSIPLIPRWTCSKKSYVHLIAIAFQLQGVLSLTVAVDRLLAIMIPIKYMKFDLRYSVILAAGPYVYVAIGTITNAIITLYDETKVPSICLTVSAVSPIFYDYIVLLRIVCVSISALLYIVIIARLNKQCAVVEKTRVSGPQLRSLKRSTVTIGLTTANAVIFLLIPDIVEFIGIFDWSRHYITILYSLSMTNVDINVMIFVFRHREIITSMKQFFCGLLRRGVPCNGSQKDVVVVLGTTATQRKDDHLHIVLRE